MFRKLNVQIMDMGRTWCFALLQFVIPLKPRSVTLVPITQASSTEVQLCNFKTRERVKRRTNSYK